MNYADEIKTRVTMGDICREYGVTVDRHNKAICPFHDDRHPSMQIYRGKGGYHCFVCGAHGDVIDFVQNCFGLTFAEAQDKINRDFVLGLPIGEKLTRRQEIEAGRKAFMKKREREQEKKTLETLEKAFYDALDEYVRYDTMLRQNAPQSAADGLKAEYVEALNNIERAKYNLEAAEWKLNKYQREEGQK